MLNESVLTLGAQVATAYPACEGYRSEEAVNDGCGFHSLKRESIISLLLTLIMKQNKALNFTTQCKIFRKFWQKWRNGWANGVPSLTNHFLTLGYHCLFFYMQDSVM